MSSSQGDVIANLHSLGRARAEGGLESPRDIAIAFGWQADKVRERQIVSSDGVAMHVGRGYFGVQPAALFATAGDGKTSSVTVAALYGYHAAIRWGLLADDEGLTLFNSHWMLQDRWYTVPTISWERLEEQRDFLETFQPHALADGAPDRIALRRYPAPSLLQPIDDELVSRLDAWRDQALKSSRIPSGVDDQLQTLFAKLFVLRIVEDRGLAPEVVPLSAALSVDSRLNLSNLARTFESAKTYIGSELFDEVALDIVPEFVVAGIIHDLYVPKRLPQYQRYNFAWIDSDVLGLAYEKYLSTILNPLPPAPQFDLFDNSQRNVERVSVRRANGVYYTPQYLTKYLARKCIKAFYDRSGAAAPPRVVDFACGSGSFLVAAVDALIGHLKGRDPGQNWARKLIEEGHISGVDIDKKAVTVARLNLWNRLAEEPDPLPLPNLSKVIVQGDGLDQSGWSLLPHRFDIALGNPPFLATARVTRRENLELEFETAKGRFDYSYLFVEQAVKLTSPDGFIGMVIPNRLFRNQNGSTIRKLLTDQMNIEAIVDFGSNEVFQGTSAYIGCIVAAHKRVLSLVADMVKVMDVKALPEQFVAGILIDAEVGDVNYPEIRVYEAQHPRGAGPWILLSKEEKRSQIQLSDASTPLASLAGIFQGIRTGANDVFILQLEAEDDQYGAQVTNGLGDSAVLERGLLQPVVYGTEVRKYEAMSFSKYLLYPYVNGTVISEAEMELRYPQTYRYILGYREILSARLSIAASGLRWYELVRRRDEDWLKRQKLLIRDLAPETSFAVDEGGGIFIVGGTAVIPEREDLLLALMVYLNSSSVNKLVRRSTPQFRGNFQKFEPQHLERIPVLNRLHEDQDFVDELTEAARRILRAATVTERSAAIQTADESVSTAMQSAGLAVIS